MSPICMGCYSGKKFVSAEGCFLEPLAVSNFTFMGWYLLITMNLRCADCLSYQTSLLIVILGKGSGG